MIILQDASIFMVLAMGMTLVITGRGIDLSIGSIATLSAVIMAMLIKDAGLNVFVGMADCHPGRCRLRFGERLRHHQTACA